MPNIFPPPAPVADASALAETLLRVLKALKAGTSVDPKHRTLGKNGLRGPQGFALIETVKAALGVGVEKGDGVLIKVLGFGEDDVPKLSAPLPVKTKKFGVGLSLGVNQVYTALLLHSDAELEAVVKGEHVIGKDVDIPGYENPSRGLTGFHKSEQSGATTISVSDSMMLCDFSLSGGKLSSDHDVLKALYGEAATAEQVLSGSVATPPEFAEAYKYLAQNFMLVDA